MLRISIVARSLTFFVMKISSDHFPEMSYKTSPVEIRLIFPAMLLYDPVKYPCQVAVLLDSYIQTVVANNCQYSAFLVIFFSFVLPSP